MKQASALVKLQLYLCVVLAAVFAAQLRAEPAQRIVSAGGSVTEIVFALGEGHRLVARDTTSNHPPEALELPDVGYIRRLSPEGVLSVDPDMIIAEEGAGPPEAFALLQETQIPVTTIPMGYDQDAVVRKIQAVADALDVPEKGNELAARVSAEIDQAAAKELNGKRVLFILSMQGGRIMAGGENTAADGIIALAGATNAVTGFEGYKPLTDEAILNAAPDVILLMDSRGRLSIDDKTLMSHAALMPTPAIQNKAIIRIDGMLLLGFSVRTGEALSYLSQELNRFGS